MFRSLACAMVMFCSACAPRAAAPTQEAEKRVEGWGPFKLGMDYDAALAAMPEARWNPSALQRCQSDLALDGCLLSQYEGVLVTIDGIGFSPMLRFDKHGQLDQISLVYEHEGHIGRSGCLDVYARALDYLAKSYGSLAFPTDAKRERGWTTERFRTSGGVAYAIGSKMGEQGFITKPIRGQLGGVSLPTSLPITRWNGKPYVSAFGFLIENNCHLSIDFSRPESPH